VKKNLRKKDKGKILAVLLTVMLIVSCMPAGIAFAAPLGGPTVAGVSPVSGNIAGGAPVTITGADLGVVSAVYFGTVAAPAFNLISGGLLTAIVPAEPAGIVAVAVYSSVYGMSSTSTPFTYNTTTQAATPTASIASNVLVADNTVVTLSDTSVSAIVYYTTDGTIPTTGSPSGTSVTITGVAGTTVTVKAFATAPTMDDSAVATFNYFLPGVGGGGGGGGSSTAYTPAVQTEAATTITATSAALNGDITSDNGYNVTDYGFLWGTSSSSLTNKLDVGTTNYTGAFTDTLSGLTTGTTYYFEAYATNSYGTADGAVMSFTAGVQTPTPTVQTEAATTITATSAALNGDITSDNGYNVTDYGFLWGTSSSSLTNKLDVGTTNYTGAFTDTLSGLTTGTTYYFEAYATNSYGTADGAVMSFTAGVQTTTTPIFSDVPASYWGYDAIISLASRGIIAGYPDGTFRPDAYISRAEFSAMLAKALGLNTSGTTGTFTDVTAYDWYYGSVNAAASADLVSGIGDKLFAPNAMITREQMAVAVTKALGSKTPATNGTELNAFIDGSAVSSWAKSGVDESVKAGIVIGMTADTLAPLAEATRAQEAAMIYKMLAFLGK
jgi:hypothetical protein